jgi:DNA-binding PadR family transcriptional regulator
MYTHAIYATGEGGCCDRGWPSSDRSYDLRSLLRAMSEHGGEHGRGGSRGRHGRHRRFESDPRGGFGPGGGPPWRGGRKARRGDIRTAALLLLAEEPRNGYQIMQEVQERSDGAWRPSSGSVYPALQQLEDEGLIRSEEIDGRKAYRLTDAGSAYLAERGADKQAPWEQMGDDLGDLARGLGKIHREVGFAFWQVLRTGADAQLEEARKVLVNARRELYRILAEGDPESE